MQSFNTRPAADTATGLPKWVNDHFGSKTEVGGEPGHWVQTANGHFHIATPDECISVDGGDKFEQRSNEDGTFQYSLLYGPDPLIDWCTAEEMRDYRTISCEEVAFRLQVARLGLPSIVIHGGHQSDNINSQLPSWVNDKNFEPWSKATESMPKQRVAKKEIYLLGKTGHETGPRALTVQAGSRLAEESAGDILPNSSIPVFSIVGPVGSVDATEWLGMGTAEDLDQYSQRDYPDADFRSASVLDQISPRDGLPRGLKRLIVSQVLSNL